MNIHDYADAGKISLRRVNDFTTGVNPLGPSDKARHGIRKMVRSLDLFPDESVRYLTGYITRVEGIEEGRLIFGAGSTHLLRVLLGVVKPRIVGVLSPCSVRLEKTLCLHGLAIRSVALDEERGFSVDAEKLCGLMEGADMVVVARPHDMTGAVIADDDMDLLIAESDRLGKTLVIDEAYRDFTPVGSPVQRAVASRSALILRTFSLFHGLAGLRFGYGVGSSRLMEEMRAAIGPLPVNGLAPHGAIISLKDAGFRTRTLKFIEEEKAYFREKLDGIEAITVLDTPCNFVLVKLRGDLNALRDSFRERNILVDGFPGKEGMTYLRLPVKKRKANAFFVRTLLRIIGG